MGLSAGHGSEENFYELDQKTMDTEKKASSGTGPGKNSGKSSNLSHAQNFEPKQGDSHCQSLVFSSHGQGGQQEEPKIRGHITDGAVTVFKSKTEIKRKEQGPTVTPERYYKKGRKGTARDSVGDSNFRDSSTNQNMNTLGITFTEQILNEDDASLVNHQNSAIKTVEVSKKQRKYQDGPLASVSRTQENGIQRKSDQSVPSDCTFADPTPDKKQNICEAMAPKPQKEAPLTPENLNKMAELALKAKLGKDFKEENCEDLRIEDFSSDEEDVCSPIQVSIGMNSSIRDQTNMHVQQEITRSSHRHELFHVPDVSSSRRSKRSSFVTPERQGQKMCNLKQSLLSSLVSSPCKYDIPQGLSVSFNADNLNSTPDRLSSKNSNSELVQFQDQNPVAIDETVVADNNILIMNCANVDDAKQNVKDLASLLSAHRETSVQNIKESANKFGGLLKLESAFDSQNMQQSRSCEKLFEVSSKGNLENSSKMLSRGMIVLKNSMGLKAGQNEPLSQTSGTKIRFSKTRRNKPIAPQMDSVIAEVPKKQQLFELNSALLKTHRQPAPQNQLQALKSLCPDMKVFKSASVENMRSESNRSEQHQQQQNSLQQIPSKRRSDSQQQAKPGCEIKIPACKAPRFTRETLSQLMQGDNSTKSASQNRSKLFKMAAVAVRPSNGKVFQIKPQNIILKQPARLLKSSEHAANQNLFLGAPEAGQSRDQSPVGAQTASKIIDPTDEYFFLSPNFKEKEDTNFLQRVHRENQRKQNNSITVSEFKVPLSSPPKKLKVNRQLSREKQSGRNVQVNNSIQWADCAAYSTVPARSDKQRMSHEHVRQNSDLPSDSWPLMNNKGLFANDSQVMADVQTPKMHNSQRKIVNVNQTCSTQHATPVTVGGASSRKIKDQPGAMVMVAPKESPMTPINLDKTDTSTNSATNPNHHRQTSKSKGQTYKLLHVAYNSQKGAAVPVVSAALHQVRSNDKVSGC